MARPRPLFPLVLATSLLAIAPACGGGTTPTPTGPGAPAAKADPGEACLEAASAKRERRPNEPARIAVKHVLVKHAFSKKPEGAPKRTREEACLRAMEARDKIRGGADFGAVVKDYSEEPGAASREGSIGQIERADVLPPFADAAFELDLNQVSDVVETEFGFHVILRSE